jgi:hypothetical protein
MVTRLAYQHFGVPMPSDGQAPVPSAGEQGALPLAEDD